MKCLPNYAPIGKEPTGFGHPVLGIFGIGTDSFAPKRGYRRPTPTMVLNLSRGVPIKKPYRVLEYIARYTFDTVGGSPDP